MNSLQLAAETPKAVATQLRPATYLLITYTTYTPTKSGLGKTLAPDAGGWALSEDYK